MIDRKTFLFNTKNSNGVIYFALHGLTTPGKHQRLRLYKSNSLTKQTTTIDLQSNEMPHVQDKNH